MYLPASIHICSRLPARRIVAPFESRGPIYILMEHSHGDTPVRSALVLLLRDYPRAEVLHVMGRGETAIILYMHGPLYHRAKYDFERSFIYHLLPGLATVQEMARGLSVLGYTNITNWRDEVGSHYAAICDSASICSDAEHELIGAAIGDMAAEDRYWIYATVLWCGQVHVYYLAGTTPHYYARDLNGRRWGGSVDRSVRELIDAGGKSIDWRPYRPLPTTASL